MNFNIIHDECRGESLSKIIRENQSITTNHFKNYPQLSKFRTIQAANRLERKDLWVEPELVIINLKKLSFVGGCL